MSKDVVAGNEVGAQRSAVERTPLLDPIDIGDAVCGRKRAATAILPAPISQIAVHAVKRIDAVVGIERKINGLPAAGRRERSAVLVAALEDWMRAERANLLQIEDSRRAPALLLTNRRERSCSSTFCVRTSAPADGLASPQSSFWACTAAARQASRALWFVLEATRLST